MRKTNYFLKIQTIALLSCSILFTACTKQDISLPNSPIQDVTKYSQNPKDYTEDISVDINQKKLTKNYLKQVFKPWDMKQLSYTAKQASWGNMYAKKKMYTENHRLASSKWYEKQILNSNFDKFNSVKRKGLIIRNTNLRVFPTKNVMFYNPKTAGEGYPFDYNQNSAIKLNTPIIISHYSKDKVWAFVQSHIALGWVRTDKLIEMSKSELKSFRGSEMFIATKDNFPIFGEHFIDNIKVGTLLPYKNGKHLVFSKNIIHRINIDINNISQLPLKLNKINMGNIASEFIGEFYGWGGLNEHRDCSSFTQDYFSTFGIYLPRNSKAQAGSYKYLDVSKKSNKEKKEFIKKNGIPFMTLVYLRGHIMLYVGIKNNEPMVMHNLWGVKTKDSEGNSGRKIVGKTVITTLEPGIELDNADKSKSIINKVNGIVLLNKVKD